MIIDIGRNMEGSFVMKILPRSSEVDLDLKFVGPQVQNFSSKLSATFEMKKHFILVLSSFV